MDARLYHAHHQRHKEDLPFWLELAAAQGGEVLELGCGAGRVSIDLVRAGFVVFGLDHDEQMLSLLQLQVSPEIAPRCHFFLADMGAFHLERRLALILLPCNTLSALPAETRHSMLALVHRQLSPGGLFAASLPNPSLLARLPPQVEPEVEDIFPHPADGEPVQVSSAWQRRGERFTITWHYDHLLPDGRVERATARVSHELIPLESWISKFRDAGLSIEACYGDFDRSPYTGDSPDLILLARASR